VRCDTVPAIRYGQQGMTDLSYSVDMILFYSLYRTLGPETFDRAYRDFFQRHRDRGARTADLVAAFRNAAPASGPILDDWLLTTAWYPELLRARSVLDLVAKYSH
jgi:aminopeptidase N